MLVALVPLLLIVDIVQRLRRGWLLFRFNWWYKAERQKKHTENPWVPSEKPCLKYNSPWLTVGPYHWQACTDDVNRNGRYDWVRILRGWPQDSEWRQFLYEDTYVMSKLWPRPVAGNDEGKTLKGASDYKVRIYKPRSRDE